MNILIKTGPLILEAKRSFSKAKLSYVAPSNHLNAIDKLNLTKKQLELLAEIKDPVLYQIIKDFCVNAQFRAEYWVKGPRRLTSFDQINEVRKIRVQLIEIRSNYT